jgi:hypothetical protein
MPLLLKPNEAAKPLKKIATQYRCAMEQMPGAAE